MQWLQTALWERHKIRTVRRTLAQLHQEAQISSFGQLSIQDEAVALVYFRAGYAPTDYPTNVEWDVRLASPVHASELFKHMQELYRGSQGLHPQGVPKQIVGKLQYLCCCHSTEPVCCCAALMQSHLTVALQFQG